MPIFSLWCWRSDPLFGGTETRLVSHMSLGRLQRVTRHGVNCPHVYICYSLYYSTKHLTWMVTLTCCTTLSVGLVCRSLQVSPGSMQVSQVLWRSFRHASARFWVGMAVNCDTSFNFNLPCLPPALPPSLCMLHTPPHYPRTPWRLRERESEGGCHHSPQTQKTSATPHCHWSCPHLYQDACSD